MAVKQNHTTNIQKDDTTQVFARREVNIFFVNTNHIGVKKYSLIVLGGHFEPMFSPK